MRPLRGRSLRRALQVKAGVGRHELPEHHGAMRRSLAVGAKRGLLLALLVGGVQSIVSYSAWRPFGVGAFLALSTYALLLTMLGSAVIPFAAVLGLLFKRLRESAVRLLAASVTCLLVLLTVSWVLTRVDDAGLRALIQRGQPIVEATLRYEKERGHPPATLQELVPDYLPSVPPTGSGAFPKWHYTPRPERPGGRWSLSVHIGVILFDFKHLTFDPEGKYLSYGTYRVGEWAVVDP